MKKTRSEKQTTGIRTDGNDLSFLSRTLEELTDFSPDADIFSYVATTLKELLGPDVVILVSSFDPESRTVVLRSFEGLDQWLPEIERLLGHPLTDLSFTIPQTADIRLQTGECNELPGGLSALTVGHIPGEICQKIESLPFFGNVYCTGISWKGHLHGSVTFIIRPGEDLQKRSLISLFVRQVAGYLRRQQAELTVRDQYAKLHGIINSSESPIFSIDRDYRYTSFNRSQAAVMKALYGVDIAIGHSLLDYITVEEVRINARKNLDRALAGEQFTDHEYSGDGAHKRIFLEVSHNPIRNYGGTVTGVAVYARDITERKKIELALRESEEQLKLALQASNFGIWTWDIATDERHIYTGGGLLFGYTEPELEEYFRNIEALVHPQDRDPSGSIPTKIRQSSPGETVELELRIRDKEGAWKTMLIRGSVVRRDPEGRPLLTMGVFRDITGRKKMEEALRESEEKYRQLYDSMTDAFACVDMRGRITLFNESFRQMVGYEPAEIATLTYNDLTPEKWHAKEAEIIKNQVLQRGYSDIFEKEYRRKDGTVFPCEIRTFLMKDTTGNNKGMWAIVRDITERKKAEEAIRNEKQFSDTIIDSIPGIFYVFDEQGRFIRSNPNHLNVLGYTEDELHRITALDTIAPEDRAIAAENIREVFSRGYTTITAKILTKDGRTIPYLLSGLSLTLEGRKYHVGTGIDITEQVRAQEALRESEKRYRDMFEINNAVMLILDPETAMIVDANAAASRFYGYSREELRSLSISAINTLEVSEIRKVLSHVAENKGAVFQFRHRKKNGEVRDVETFSAPLVVGNRLLLHSIIQDVTERNRAEAALKSREELLRLFTEHAPAALAMLDGDLRYIAVSNRWRADYHLGDRDLIGHSHIEIFPELSEEIIAVLRRGLAGEVSSSKEDRLVRQDGAVQWLAWEVRPWYISGRNIGGVIVFSEDITARKLAEEALRQSEEKYRAIVENNQNMVYRADLNGIFTMVNPAGARLAGFASPKEMVGRPVADCYLNPDDRLVFLEALKKNGSVENYPVVLKAADGTVRHVLSNSHFFYDPEGNVQGIEGILQDVTELRQIEEALQQSEKKYRDIIENIQDMVYRADMNGIFTMVNPAGVRLFGFSSEAEMTGRPVTDVYANPDDRRIFLEALKKTGSVYGYPLILKSRNGTLIHILASSHYLHDASGNVLGVEGAFHDVTELRRMEDALHTAQEKFSKAFEEAPDAITLSDLDSGEFLEVNNATTKIYGYSKDELIGHTATELGIWLDGEKREEFFSQLRKEGRIEQYEIVERRKSGELFYCHVNADTILIGNRKCVIAVIRDVTEQKNAQDALKKAHDELEVRVLERTKALRDSEERLRLKLDSVLSPDTDISELELANILDIPEIQALMEDFSRLTGMSTAVLDMKGNIIESTGGQDICTKFHRKNERTAKFCTESDLFLAENLTPGQHVIYKCKNGLWDVATPIYFGTKHAGNIYTGQFFFTDEPVDEKAFLARAEKFGFDKNEYMAALSRVPRFSREQVDILMDYLVRFTLLISRISFSNLQLAQAKNRLELTAEDLRNLSEDLDRRVIERTAELSRAQEAYQKANKKLNLLSSITRHDIKNQLLVLSGYLEISKKSLPDPAKTAEFIAKEMRIADTIAHQISFTKDYEDLGVKAPVWQNVDEVIHRAVARLPLGKVRVITGESALEIFADPLLEKVFYNLTDNALRYGGEKMTCIRASRHINNGNLILIFEDDGEGIRNEDKARLFTKGFGKNTGLGLYLSREILSITDITITENGEPGKGARFEITIPHGMYREAKEEN